MYRELSQLKDIRGDLPRNGSFSKRSWSKITDIARHHSGEDAGDAYAYANYHVHTLGWPGIGYHFVITKDGTIQWCNSVERVSYGVGNHNTPLIHISLVGNGSFTDAQENSYYELVGALFQTKGLNLSISRMKGHNEYSGHQYNACPGIDMNVVRNAIRADHPVGQPVKGTSTEDSTSSASLQRGDNGDDVELLQLDLIAVGEDLSEYGADSDFGKETEDAVKSFQLKHDISSESGNYFGVAGPATMAKLEELTVPDKEEVSGKMAVVTAERVNVRNHASSDDSAVAGQVEEGEAFTIVAKVKPTGHIDAMYELKSGLYITAHEDYVSIKDVSEPEPEDRMVIVAAESVNVRSEPKLRDEDAIAGKVYKGEAFTVVDTLDADDADQTMYELKSGLFITAHEDYVELRK